MSYILDALKKSEQERKKGKVPGLDTVQDFPTRRNRVARPPWILISVAALALNALLFGIWIYSERGDTPEPEIAAVVPVKPDHVTAPFVSADVPENEPAQPTIPVEIENEEMAGQSDAKAPVQTTEVPVAALTENETELADEATESVVPETDVEQLSIPVEEFPSVAEEDEDAEPDSDKLIAFKNLPYGIKSGLPEIRIALHYYSSDHTSRKASINGRMMREGSEIGKGLILKEITQAGVIFLYQNTLFSYEVFSR